MKRGHRFLRWFSSQCSVFQNRTVFVAPAVMPQTCVHKYQDGWKLLKSEKNFIPWFYFFVDSNQVLNYFIVLHALIYNPKAEHLSGLCGPFIIFVHLVGLCLNELFTLIFYSQTTGCSWNNKAKTVLHKWSIHFYSVSIFCVLIIELWYLSLLYIWSFPVLTQVLKAHRHSYILTLNYCRVLDISRHWHC